MSYWSQLPWLTKVILAVLAGTVLLFVVFLLIRVDILSVDWSLPDDIYEGDTESTEDATVVPGVEPQVEPSLEPTSTTSGLLFLTAITNADILTGPGNVFEIIGILENGQTAEVIGVSPDEQWWVIKIPDTESGQGWISADQVIVENTVGVPVVAVPTVVAVANVNVRSGPGMSYEKIGLLSIGQAAEVVGIDPSGSWWAIKAISAASGLGWVASDYVIPDNTEDVPVISPQISGGTGTVLPTGSSIPSLTTYAIVNIRSGPGTQHDIIGKLEQGQQAEVIGISADRQWWVIKFPAVDTGYGWVSAEYVRVENTEDVPVVK